MVAARDGGNHRPLFKLFGLVVTGPSSAAVGDPSAPVAGPRLRRAAVYRELSDQPELQEDLLRTSVRDDIPDILNIRSRIGARSGDDLSSVSADRTVLIGNLDSFPSLRAFRLGFVAGHERLLKRVLTWKQAFSICTAAPSQRAAVFSLDGWQRRER